MIEPLNQRSCPCGVRYIGWRPVCSACWARWRRYARIRDAVRGFEGPPGRRPYVDDSPDRWTA